jgi:predicted AAA+ superfamily ATPase
MVKSPKMYFYDTGLASFLLNISDAEQFSIHHMRGGLFENFIILEFLKYRYNKGFQPDLYFWRDHKGKELGIILETPKGVFPYEIKSGKTFSYDYFSNLDYWNKISGEKSAKNTVIYGGSETIVLSDKMAIAWTDLNLVFESVS